MRITGQNPYAEVYNRSNAELFSNRAVADENSAVGKQAKTSDNTAAASETSDENLISRSERDFFIKMFPQNSEQLEKHVVFNRQGRIQTNNVSKGSIIDGRV